MERDKELPMFKTWRSSFWHRPMTRSALTGFLGLLVLAAPAPAVEPLPSSPHRLELPPVAVEVDLAGLVLTAETERRDGRGKALAAQDPGRGLVLSVFLEEQPAASSVEECRELYWQKSQDNPVPKTGVRRSERGPLRLLEWTVQEYRGLALRQHHVHGYLHRQGHCLEVHLSKVGFGPADQPFFDRVLDSVRWVEP
jgi:hypothetical protein